MNNKPLCDEYDCPSKVAKAIDVKPYVDSFIDQEIKNNPDARPQCIKRIVYELLKDECDRLFFELTAAQQAAAFKYEERNKK